MGKDKAEQIRQHFTDYTVYDFLASVMRHGKRILVLSVLLAGVTFLASILLVSREYIAKSTLIVAEPPYKTPMQPTDKQMDVPSDPLSPKAYQQLLRSPELVRQVVSRLNGRIEEQPVLEDFTERLSVGLVTQKERLTTVFTPIIELTVRGPDPEECRLIANTWADVATSASMLLRNAEIIRFNQLIHEQYEIQDRRMTEIEDAQRRFEEETDLSGKEALLAPLGKAIAESQTELVKVQVELSAARGQKAGLEKAAEAYHVGGKWVGALEPLPIAEKDVDESALEMFRARTRLLDVKQRRADFKSASRIETKIKLRDNLTDEVKLIENRLDSALDALAGEEARAKALESVLAQDKPLLAVRKAVTDDAIWQALADRAEALDKLKDKVLTEETVNEAYSILRQEYGKALGEANAKKAAVESARRVLDEQKKRLDTLDAEVARLQEELLGLDLAIENASKHYGKVYEYYTEVAVELSRARDMTRRYETQLADLEAQFRKNREELHRTGSAVGAGLVTRGQFQRTIEAQKTLYEEVARRNARAHMADIEKTGDLRVAFYAPLPEKSFARQKQRNFTGAVFALSLVAFAIYFAARDRTRAVSRPPDA